MRRYSVTLSVLLLSAMTARAGAESYFEERMKDFGTVPRGPMLVHYFKLTNTTSQTITISSLGVSCGCVTVSAPVAQVEAGKSIHLTAQMDSRRFTGSKSVTIYVRFSQPYYEEVTLQVKAFGRDDFAITPDTLAFGTVRRGKEVKTTVQVSFYGDPNFTLSKPVADSNYIKPEVNQIKREGSHVVYEVSAAVRPDLPVGKWYTDVWVQSSHASMPKLRIPLTIEMQPSVAISPSAVQFGEVALGKKSEQRVLVRGDKPFKILDIQGIDESILVNGKADDAKAVHILTFVYDPKKSGEVSKTIKLNTDGDEKELTIPIRGLAVEK